MYLMIYDEILNADTLYTYAQPPYHSDYSTLSSSTHWSGNKEGFTVTVTSYLTSQPIFTVRSLLKRLPSALKNSGR